MSHARHDHRPRQRGESNSTELTDPACGMSVKKTSLLLKCQIFGLSELLMQCALSQQTLG